MAFEEKFSLIPLEQQEIILQEARENGAFATAEKWADQIGMSFNGLYKRLRKDTKQTYNPMLPKGQRFTEPKKNEERKLSREEKELIEKLKSGEAGIEETSRLVAVRVFENMLKNPDKFVYADFIKTELLKIKKDESVIKEGFAKALIGKMFAGQLPNVCPHCGKSLVKEIVEGEIIPNGELTTGL